ncbi:MAG: GNAT family N-acetyltransferase, partial [Kofleriaceae bacterium]|nr:GNAT family N-acetyltransferase [Kofleriaceae bacterium]
MPRLAAVGRLYVLDREAVQRREVMRAQRYGAALWWQTATMTTTIRAIRDDEVNAFRIALMTVFGGDADDDPHGDDRFRHLVAREQAWAAFDGPHIVATTASYNMEIVVPGGTLPMAGLTNVTVRPTHRRRGLLRALIGHHLDDAKARGFAASGLWASEASIYRRFGYGMAASHDQVEISNAHSG